MGRRLGAGDVDKTLRVISGNGAAVVRVAEDTPYGRLAAATGPHGFQLQLVVAAGLPANVTPAWPSAAGATLT